MDGKREEDKEGMLRTLMSRGIILYSMSRSLNTLIISWTTSSLLFHLSPMFWWFIRWENHNDTFNLFMSSMSLSMTVGFGCQCSVLLSINLPFRRTGNLLVYFTSKKKKLVEKRIHWLLQRKNLVWGAQAKWNNRTEHKNNTAQIQMIGKYTNSSNFKQT